MDEDARRPRRQSALRDAFGIREERRPARPEKRAAIYFRRKPHAAAGSRWDHHAERFVLRASPRRHPEHRSGAASIGSAWAGREAADLHDGRYQALSLAIAYLLPRMLGQSRLHQALWQDRVRSRRLTQLR